MGRGRARHIGNSGARERSRSRSAKGDSTTSLRKGEDEPTATALLDAQKVLIKEKKKKSAVAATCDVCSATSKDQFFL